MHAARQASDRENDDRDMLRSLEVNILDFALGRFAHYWGLGVSMQGKLMFFGKL